MTEDWSAYIEGWAGAISSSATALLLAARCIWPSFVQVGGIVYVVLGYTTADEVREYVSERMRNDDEWETLSGELRRRRGEIFGEIDLGIDFSRPLTEDDPIDQSLDDLAKLVSTTWPLAAGVAFRGRSFECHVRPADVHSGPMVVLAEIGPSTPNV